MSKAKTSVAFLLNPEPVESYLQHRPASISITRVLPAELLSEIFYRLSFDRRDISACRLACRDFHTLSSPYLITYAVWSSRPPALKKLQQLLDHGYFKKYIRELVVDISVYIPRQLDLEDYIRQCDSSSRALERYPGPDQDYSPPDFNAPADCYQTGAYKVQTAKYGFALGWEDYCKLRDGQLRSQGDGSADRVLHRAFRELPAVRDVAFGDYRCLTLNGESHSDLCNRLFGNTLQPLTLDNTYLPGRFLQNRVNQILAELPANQVRRFTFNLHPFRKDVGVRDCELETEERRGDCIAVRNDTVEVIPAEDHVSTPEPAESVFEGLVHLDYDCLPCFPEDFGHMDEELPLIFPLMWKRRLTSASSSLESLVLASSFIRAYGHHEQDPYRSMGPPGSETPQRADDPTGDPQGFAFPTIMAGITLPHLRKLQLRGFKLYTPALINFLSGVSCTLRELRLIKNSFRVDEGEGLSTLATWGGKHLQLTSMEFDNYSDVDIMSTSEADRRTLEIQEEDFQSKPLPPGEMVWSPCMLDRMRRELESMWLGGRHNSFEKEYDCTHSEPIDQECRQWGNEPAYWT